MNEEANRQTVQDLIDAINNRQLDLFHQQFAEEAVMEYPQSGERIVGGAKLLIGPSRSQPRSGARSGWRRNRLPVTLA